MNKDSIKITGYHATNSSLVELNYDKLLLNRTNHQNGALGLWCGIRSDWIKGFGQNTFEVSIEGLGYDMPIIELFNYTKIYDSTEQYTARRNELLSQNYDFIRIIESNGNCDMFVVLNFAKAKIKEFPD